MLDVSVALAIWHDLDLSDPLLLRPVSVPAIPFHSRCFVPAWDVCTVQNVPREVW